MPMNIPFLTSSRFRGVQDFGSLSVVSVLPHLLCQLLKSQAVARMLDKKSAGVLGKYFRCEELNTLTLLMQMVETILEHKNMVKSNQAELCF